LQRFGSFLNCLSKKKSCSPAVKTNSAPQSTHFKTLSWNSMRHAPFSATCASREGFGWFKSNYAPWVRPARTPEVRVTTEKTVKKCMTAATLALGAKERMKALERERPLPGKKRP
jgi:hypothetical protein